MELPENCIIGTIQKRYKRFLADIQLDDNTIIQAHVPNTGSMKGCWEPGWKALVSRSLNPKRKLAYTLEMTHNGVSWIGVNTSRPNQLVWEALKAKALAPFRAYQNIKREYKFGQSRLDFYLTDEALVDCYIEVKNVTLKEQGDLALFPDAISQRGQKHLNELINIKQQGHRASMVYIIQRMDTRGFSPARKIDPDYANLLKKAQQKGIEIYCYQCQLSESHIHLDNREVELFL